MPPGPRTAAPPGPSLTPTPHPLLRRLGLPPFRARLPWWGGDLQTLRDSLVAPPVPLDPSRRIEIEVGGGHRLLARLDTSLQAPVRALVLLVHGLGGDSEGPGLRRLAGMLCGEGFTVLRLNLRGAGEGRPLAPGGYAAACSRDLLPVLARARHLATGLAANGSPPPLYAVGLSLGGTVLLNACLDAVQAAGGAGDPLPPLDRLVCISSPLDLEASAARIDAPRNLPYRRWMLHRLTAQTLRDPFGAEASIRTVLTTPARPRTIRGFDEAVTAPRWGYASAGDYYRRASPLARMHPGRLPPTLMVHALDDPWVPAGAAGELADRGDPDLPVVLCPSGGHNGFHGRGLRRVVRGAAPMEQMPDQNGCWSDHLVSRWLRAAAEA